MDIKTKEMYSEISSILAIMDDEYVKRLPQNLYDLIEKNKLETYTPIYDPEESLANQTMSRDTATMLVLLKLNYWCDSEAEKEEIRDSLRKNSEAHTKIMREKYSSVNMFKHINGEDGKENEDIKENNNMVKYDKEGFFKKLFKKIFGKK